MHVIRAMNVNDAYAQGVRLFGQRDAAPPGPGERGLLSEPIALPSRAGDVLMWPEPVCTVYSRPTECILWDAKRDANPFLHLFESLWMLAGCNDVAYLEQFSKGIGSFIDDGTGLQHGAYGHRWRHWWARDQLFELAELMRADKLTRRAVLQMWCPDGDLWPLSVKSIDGIGNESWGATGKGGAKSIDIPCNLTVAFSCRATGDLDMTVFCRSNDMILGAYGANAVHFSFLLQYMAAAIGVPVGVYRQVSNDMHVYTKSWADKVRDDLTTDPDLYDTITGPSQLVHGRERADEVLSEIAEFVLSGNEDTGRYASVFLRTVAAPLLAVWYAWKSKDRALALAMLTKYSDGRPDGQLPDWFIAARMWMLRRIK